LVQSPRGVLEPIAAAAVVLAALRALAWRNYRGALDRTGAPTRALVVLATFAPWFFIFGLALPVLSVVAGVVAANAAPYLFAFAGASMVAAGAALKFILVTRAGYNQGFALSHTPMRGSGRPGPAVKPGWTEAIRG
jgi:phenylacetyl-CoA:acceptor oxidoreductase subunit 2